jgi:hypothetical protein
MKYIVKTEIAVYECSDDMNDVIRVDYKATSDSYETAVAFGERLRAAVQGVFDGAIRKPKS